MGRGASCIRLTQCCTWLGSGLGLGLGLGLGSGLALALASDPNPNPDPNPMLHFEQQVLAVDREGEEVIHT